MIRNIRLTIEYDGTRFCGWQAQRKRTPHHSLRSGAGQKIKTVQEEIEKAGKRLFGKKISLTGAGRTDSGVHAEAQTANFSIDSSLPLHNIKKGLNNYLPKDIAILSADDVKSSFHSRFNAKEK
ncbi:tRNA pseudouridine(38-40) synthase TruA, partial [Candidatus Omnitrophota bacterium]